MTTLYRHQSEILTRNPERRLLAWDVGTGKTLAMLSLADKNADTVLIVTPKGMKEQWAAKIKEYGIVRSAFIVTKEEMRRDFEKLPAVDAVLIDEVHHFSGCSSQMHKNLIKYLHRTNPKYVWGGTATPYRSEPLNIWALGKIFGYMPRRFDQFRSTFYFPMRIGRRMIWKIRDNEEMKDRLHGYLNAYADVVKMEECFDVPDQVDMAPEVFDMTPEQKRAIKKLELEEILPIVLYGKTHQIEQGQLKGNEYVPDEYFDSTKDARILELASEHPKLLIFCRYTLQIYHLQKILKKAGYDVATITGENSEDHFDISTDAEKLPKCILIAQTSVAAGWEVPSFPVVVFASMSYSYLDYVQSRGRVIRGNKLQKHVFLPLISGEIDQAVYDCVLNKRDFDPAKWEPTI